MHVQHLKACGVDLKGLHEPDTVGHEDTAYAKGHLQPVWGMWGICSHIGDMLLVA